MKYWFLSKVWRGRKPDVIHINFAFFSSTFLLMWRLSWLVRWLRLERNIRGMFSRVATSTLNCGLLTPTLWKYCSSAFQGVSLCMQCSLCNAEAVVCSLGKPGIISAVSKERVVGGSSCMYFCIWETVFLCFGNCISICTDAIRSMGKILRAETKIQEKKKLFSETWYCAFDKRGRALGCWGV